MLKLSHVRIFSHPKILFLVPLLFVALLNSIPTYLLNFYFLSFLCYTNDNFNVPSGPYYINNDT